MTNTTKMIRHINDKTPGAQARDAAPIFADYRGRYDAIVARPKHIYSGYRRRAHASRPMAFIDITHVARAIRS